MDIDIVDSKNQFVSELDGKRIVEFCYKDLCECGGKG